MTTTILTSPVLRGTAKTGKTTHWLIELLGDGAGNYFIQRTWWQDNDARQSSTPEQVVGKNTGKANATSDYQQAEKAFQRAIQQKRDRGFSEDGTKSHIYTQPMLAQVFADRASALKYPVFVQPKLDGFRMLMDGVNAWSRGGKDHLRACVQHLIWDVGDYTLDGELLLPGNKKLQVTNSAATKYQRGISETLEYHVYDLVDTSLPFSERTAVVHKLLADSSKIPPRVKLVPTLPVTCEEDVRKAHKIFVDYGYEGSIIRTAEGRYEPGYRSYGLLKLKDFKDAEFQVVDVEHGKGSFSDKAILVFEAKPGIMGVRAPVTFKAVPEGNEEYRRNLWKNRMKLIGQWWTVRYVSLSAEGKPVHAVAVAPRDKGEFK